MRKLDKTEIIKSIFYATILFIVLWIVTGLWNNSFFTRMTPTTNIDIIILTLESIIIWFYMWTKANTKCDYSKKATIWWIFGFLGFWCLVCNKILLIIFWSSFLLSYIEPIRYYIGFLWIGIMGYFLYKKLKS